MPEWEWRCTACRTLLGIERGGRLHLKYKKADFVVEGFVRAVCRSCGATNETRTPPRGARAGPASAAVGNEAASAR